MITLMELVRATGWLEPQNHIKVTLWNKDKVYEDDEFQDIDLNVYNFARYGDFWVQDIDIEWYQNNDKNPELSCLIWKD